MGGPRWRSAGQSHLEGELDKEVAERFVDTSVSELDNAELFVDIRVPGGSQVSCGGWEVGDSPVVAFPRPHLWNAQLVCKARRKEVVSIAVLWRNV